MTVKAVKGSEMVKPSVISETADLLCAYRRPPEKLPDITDVFCLTEREGKDGQK